ncbi:MAG: hypothetical protein AAF688_12680 [Bacteroidota bacterium]
MVCFSINAQVGVGTVNPNPSSILDVESDSQGLLIPRVALTGTSDTTTITEGNVESLLVYNTQTVSDVTPGFYYWDSSSWIRVAAGSGGGLSDNLYTSNGVLSSNRNVTQNNFDLNFDNNTFVIDGASNNVGVGVNNPAIDIAIGDSDTGLQQQGNGQLAVFTNNVERVRFANNGRVGVGINAPTERFHVEGTSRLDDNIIQDGNINLNQRGDGDRNSALRFYSDADTANEAEILRRSGANGDLVIDNEGNGIMFLRNRGNGRISLGTNNSDDLSIENGGNVGIGMNNPTEKLDVNGSLRIRTIADTGGNTNRILLTDNSGVIRRATAAEIVAAGGGDSDNIYETNGTITANRTVNLGERTIDFNGNSDNGFQVDGATFTVDMDTDRIGVGTNAPTERLDVNGNVRLRTVPNTGGNTDRILITDNDGVVRRATATEIVSAGGGNTDNIYSTNGSITSNRTVGLGERTIDFNGNADNGFQVDGATFTVDMNTNRIGLGTDAPTERLHVQGNSRLGNNMSSGGNFSLNQSGTGNRSAALRFFADDDTSNEAELVRQAGANGNFVIDNEGNGIMFLRNRGNGRISIGTNNSDDFSIENGGNVGIGITNPTERLHVNGNTRLANNMSSGGNFDLNQRGTGNRNSSLRFHSDEDTANDAEISRRSGVDGNFIIDNEGNGIMFLRNRGNGRISLGTNNSDDLSIENGGNVGIGVSDPTQKLDVNGTMRVRSIPEGGGNINRILVTDNNGNVNRTTAADIVAAGSASFDNIYSTDGTISANRSITMGNRDLNFDANTLVIDGSANRVGIGTNAPSEELDVDGTGRIRDLGGSGDRPVYVDNNGVLSVGAVAKKVAASGDQGIVSFNDADSYRNLTAYSSNAEVENGEIMIFNWSAIAAPTEGDGVDDFYFRVYFDGSGGCSDFSQEYGPFTPNETTDEHDNAKSYSGTGFSTANCNGNYRVRLQGRNVGDDAWTAYNRNVTFIAN